MDRVALAKDRLFGLKRDFEARSLFCVDCVYLRGEKCANPAVAATKLDPVTGRVTQPRSDALEARSDFGPCGPEAALYDPRPVHELIARSAWNGAMQAVGLGVLCLTAIGVAHSLLY